MEFSKNEKYSRFELTVEGGTAFIDYEKEDPSKIYLTYIEVPDQLEGQGVGSELTKRTLEYIDEHDLSLIAQCPFIKSYIQRHPEYKSLLDSSVDL